MHILGKGVSRDQRKLTKKERYKTLPPFLKRRMYKYPGFQHPGPDDQYRGWGVGRLYRYDILSPGISLIQLIYILPM